MEEFMAFFTVFLGSPAYVRNAYLRWVGAVRRAMLCGAVRCGVSGVDVGCRVCAVIWGLIWPRTL